VYNCVAKPQSKRQRNLENRRGFFNLFIVLLENKMVNLLAQTDTITPDLIIPEETTGPTSLITEPPPAGNINCNYYNPLMNNGQPPTKISDPFQFASSTCSLPAGSTASTTAGFTNGDIINGVLLFLILMVLSFNLFLKMLYPRK
jgi:hypothetical protein